MDRRSCFCRTPPARRIRSWQRPPLAAPAYAQGNRTLTMVTSVPDGFAIFDDCGPDGCDRAITEMYRPMVS